MLNTGILALSLIVVGLVIVSFVGYMLVTNNIIKTQEKEIAELKTRLKREKQRENLQIICDGRHPKFGDF